MRHMYLLITFMLSFLVTVGVQKSQAIPTLIADSSTPGLHASGDVKSFDDAPGFRHNPLNSCVDGLGNFSFGTCQRRWHDRDGVPDPEQINDGSIVPVTHTSATAIPEPTTVTLMLVGVGVLVLRGRRFVSINRQ